MNFPLYVAIRYLMARRKQAVISVITVISVLGVAAGVMALVIALGINAGFRNTLQRNLLGATAHVILMEKTPERGIENWRELTARMAKLDHVTQSSASLYGQVIFSGPGQSAFGTVKGILPPGEAPRPEALLRLKQGTFRDWNPVRGFPPIILGSRLAQTLGMTPDAVVSLFSPEMTPMGRRMVEHRFRVIGIFETGFFDLDGSWAFTSLAAVQRVLSVDNVANAIELQLDDIYRAPQVAEAAEKAGGEGLAATHWMEQNRQLLNALRMEKAVTWITIGLIQMVGALNILISLIMMVMEKHRDIAILMSLGTRRQQIARIFMLQGLLIGAVGTVLGLAAGYSLCYFADRGRWIQLDEAIYSLSFVPFEPRALDGVWIAGVALAVSFLATIYPARSATRIAPAEALRYE